MTIFQLYSPRDPIVNNSLPPIHLQYNMLNQSPPRLLIFIILSTNTLEVQLFRNAPSTAPRVLLSTCIEQKLQFNWMLLLFAYIVRFSKGGGRATAPPKMRNKITCKWCDGTKMYTDKYDKFVRFAPNHVRIVFTRNVWGPICKNASAAVLVGRRCLPLLSSLRLLHDVLCISGIINIIASIIINPSISI